MGPKPDPAIDALARRAVAAGGKSLSVGDVIGKAPARRNKYGAVRTIYWGESYDSRAEADYAAWLDLEARVFPGMFWVRQVTFRLGCPENVYRADFLVYAPWAPVPIRAVDVKGVRTAKFRHDLKLWQAYGPCLLVIAMRDRRRGWKYEYHPGREQP